MSDGVKVGYAHYPHGWMGFKPRFDDVISTIDTGIAFWRTLIVEETEDEQETDETSDERADL